MSMIDTAAADAGSNESIIMDTAGPLNEMAMGWFSAITGKGVATGYTPSGGNYTVGVSGTTLPAVAQSDAIGGAPATSVLTSTPLFQSPLVLVALVALVALLAFKA